MHSPSCHCRNRIKNLLDQGITIVSDRFYHSGMVYSAAKGNPSLSLAWARAPEVGLPRPDLVVFLDLEPEEAARRGGWGEEKYEKEEMQKKVRELFRQLADDEQAADDKELELVNAGGSVEEVSEKIWDLVRTRVDEIKGEIRTVQ